MLQLALIKPVALIDRVPDPSPYHLVLHSLMVSEPAYRAAYIRRMLDGHLVIYDNDAWENGVASSVDGLVESLLDLIHIVPFGRPYEGLEGLVRVRVPKLNVVIPDCIYKADETLALGAEALKVLRDRLPAGTVDYIAIPQGETLSDWCRCADQMADWEPNVWGLTRCVEPLGTKATILANVLTSDFARPIHMFGVPNDRELWRGAAQSPYVRGVDTTEPVLRSLTDAAGVPFHYTKRPADYFGHTCVDMDSVRVELQDLFQLMYDPWGAWEPPPIRLTTVAEEVDGDSSL